MFEVGAELSQIILLVTCAQMTASQTAFTFNFLCPKYHHKELYVYNLVQLSRMRTSTASMPRTWELALGRLPTRVGSTSIHLACSMRTRLSGIGQDTQARLVRFDLDGQQEYELI